MKTMTLAELHAAVKAQGVARDDYAVVCPMCKTAQSPRDLIAAGAGGDFEEVQRYLGYSCFGRWTGAGSSRKVPDGKPCNWTLGGLFQFHEIEVITEDGEHHPHFEPASPEQAQTHAAEWAKGAAA